MSGMRRENLCDGYELATWSSISVDVDNRGQWLSSHFYALVIRITGVYVRRIRDRNTTKDHEPERNTNLTCCHPGHPMPILLLPSRNNRISDPVIPLAFSTFGRSHRTSGGLTRYPGDAHRCRPARYPSCVAVAVARQIKRITSGSSTRLPGGNLPTSRSPFLEKTSDP